MARLRLLFSLFLVVLGAMLGGVALSGYYDLRATHARTDAAPASVAEPSPASSSELAGLQGRQRFVASDQARPPAKPIAAPKASAAKPPAIKAKTAAQPKPRPDARPAQPKQAALPWPWSLFSN
jgi:hypothetical protein